MIKEIPLPASMAALMTAGSLYMGDSIPEKPLIEPNNTENVQPVEPEVVTPNTEKIVIPISDSDIDQSKPEPVIELPKPVEPVQVKQECGFKNRVNGSDPSPDFFILKQQKAWDASPQYMRDAMGPRLEVNAPLSKLTSSYGGLMKAVKSRHERLEELLAAGTGFNGTATQQYHQLKSMMKQRRGQSQ